FTDQPKRFPSVDIQVDSIQGSYLLLGYPEAGSNWKIFLEPSNPQHDFRVPIRMRTGVAGPTRRSMARFFDKPPVETTCARLSDSKSTFTADLCLSNRVTRNLPSVPQR